MSNCNDTAYFVRKKLCHVIINSYSGVRICDKHRSLTQFSEIDEAKALKIALGNLDPISGETLGDFDGFLVSFNAHCATLHFYIPHYFTNNIVMDLY